MKKILYLLLLSVLLATTGVAATFTPTWLKSPTYGQGSLLPFYPRNMETKGEICGSTVLLQQT